MEVIPIEKRKLGKSDISVSTTSMGTKALSVLLILITFVFAGCERYEEDIIVVEEEIPTSFFSNGGSSNQTGVVSGENIVVSIRGSGGFTLSGICNFAEITVQSSGIFDGSNLEIRGAEVSSRGSGHIYVWATDWLDVEIRGSGNVYYKGNPQINSKINSSGKLIKM